MSAAYLAVVNPAAGGGRCGKAAPDAVARLREGGVEVDVVETSAAGQGVDLVRRAYAEGRRKFIAVGGDGTSYEIINGLFPEAAAGNPEERVSLGFLPLGTGNSFLRDFTDRGAEDSIPALLGGRRRSCDVVRLTHAEGQLHYINILSIGFVADVNGLRQRKFRRYGEGGYVLAVLAELGGLQSRFFPMALDGGPMRREPVTFISVNNSRYTGGKMMMAPSASTSDGKADLICVGRLGRLSLLRTFPKIFSGTHVEHPAVSTAQVAHLEFGFDDVIDVMVDGEALQVAPRAIEVVPGAIDVVI